ncbi:DUF6461 domain-containing protein [Streptomyces sp. NBC_01800]|uniref:DUF6461 domain-containing protein n=1 Tax=Streptomyces sp. NBC_01800 TaxID=2975945 RepID=UPI002DDBA3AC|nr:DUF6461 domain-containing protein [Streptomyces sp. NBC_01800]WSA73972.1 DUF6461 domain-containing protein [Streptomyces sp. NBC_01800]
MDPRPGVRRRRGPDSGVPRYLSAGTRAVTHSSNGGKPVHLFHRFERSELRTAFEWPSHRTGSTPDALKAAMREVGFHLTATVRAHWRTKGAQPRAPVPTGGGPGTGGRGACRLR